MRFSPWPHYVYLSLRKSFKDVLFTGATGLWMLLTAESFVLSPPLETGHGGWGEEAAHSEHCPCPPLLLARPVFTWSPGGRGRLATLVQQPAASPSQEQGWGPPVDHSPGRMAGFNHPEVWVPTESQNSGTENCENSATLM